MDKKQLYVGKDSELYEKITESSGKTLNPKSMPLYDIVVLRRLSDNKSFYTLQADFSQFFAPYYDIDEKVLSQENVEKFYENVTGFFNLTMDEINKDFQGSLASRRIADEYIKMYFKYITPDAPVDPRLSKILENFAFFMFLTMKIIEDKKKKGQVTSE